MLKFLPQNIIFYLHFTNPYSNTRAGDGIVRRIFSKKKGGFQVNNDIVYFLLALTHEQRIHHAPKCKCAEVAKNGKINENKGLNVKVLIPVHSFNSPRLCGQ